MLTMLDLWNRVNLQKIALKPYSKNPHTRNCNLELSLFMFLCDEVSPDIRVPALHQGSQNARENGR